MTVLPRIKGWERALLVALRKHASLPFEYGVSDCATFPMDVVLALTGVDPLAELRGYEGAIGAARRLAEHGAGNIGELFAQVLPEIHPAMAGRGDLVVVAQDGGFAGAVCAGHQLAGKAPDGLFYVPRSRATRAFRVG